MKTLNITQKLILAALPALMFACGNPSDREAVINPAVEGKMIVLKNVSDLSNVSSANQAVYLKTKTATTSTTSFNPYLAPQQTSTNSTTSTTTITSTSSTTEQKSLALSGDPEKIVNLVASAGRKAFLAKHINDGGRVGFAIHDDHIRVYALTTKEVISKISGAPKDLGLTDIRNAKNSKLAKAASVDITRRDDPAGNERFVEVAVIELEKMGVLESEKTDYNETKPLLNILINLPLEVSTHALMKQELVIPGAKSFTEVAAVEPKK